MPGTGTITPKKKKKKSSGFPFLMPKQKERMDKLTGKSKPMEASMGGKVKYAYKGGKIGDGNYKSCGANIVRTK